MSIHFLNMKKSKDKKIKNHIYYTYKICAVLLIKKKLNNRKLGKEIIAEEPFCFLRRAKGIPEKMH